MKYFLFEPANEGKPAFLATEAEWKKAIEDFNFYDSYHDDGWSEEVTTVFAGAVPDDWKYDEDKFDNFEDALKPFKTHEATVTNRRDKPDDLDEDGYSESTGESWTDEWAYMCDYELLPVTTPKEQP